MNRQPLLSSTKSIKFYLVGIAVGLVMLVNTDTATAATLSIDFNDRDNDTPALTQSGFDSFIIGDANTDTDVFGSVTRTYGPISVTVIGITSDEDSVVPRRYRDRLRGAPLNSGSFTQENLLRDLIFSDARKTGGLSAHVTGLVPYGVYSGSVWSFDTGSNSPRVADWTANGAIIKEDYSWDGTDIDATSGSPADNDVYRIPFQVVANSLGEVTIRVANDLSTTSSSSIASHWNAFELDHTSTLPVISTPLLSVDFGQNSSPFSGFTGVDDDALLGGPVTVGSHTVSVTGVGSGVVLEDRQRSTPVNGGLFTEDALIQDFVHAKNSNTTGEGLDVEVGGLDANTEYYVTVWSFDRSNDENRASTWTSGDTTVNYQFDGEILPSTDNDYKFSFLATTDGDGKLSIEGRYSDTSKSGVSHTVFLNALQVQAVVPEPGSFLLVALGFIGLAGYSFCRRKTN